MRKTLLVIFFLQFLFFGNAQSIVVNGSGDNETNFAAEQLLTDVLLDGGLCSSTSNFQLKDNPLATFPDANRSWGYFKKGSSNFPFERGIVLTSGYALIAQGPDTGIVSDGTYDWTGDSDANYLAGTETNNVTIFEFDFIPQGNEISFNYIFASEEYPEFSCNSTYNDVFGFIISGPGIENDPGLSGKNIALLPNGDPVTINNVNDQGCGDDTYYVAGPFTNIQHGGRTIPLTAYSAVQPGQTYHIRLLVADAGDTQYDSAVFLEAGSFNLGSTIVDENGIDIGENMMVCGQEEFTLFVNIDDPSVELQWYKNDEIIPGATSNTLTINESATYKIEVVSGDCSASDEVVIVFGDLETNGTNFFIELPDTGNDGTEIFDLTVSEVQIVNNPAEHTFSYYESQNNADNEVDPITNPTAYSASNNTIVYVRVENADGCYAVVMVNLRLETNDNPCDFTPICSTEDITATPVPTDPITLRAECVTMENADELLWYYIKIEEGSTFTFVITPDGNNDYDFLLWHNVEDCNNLQFINEENPGTYADRASYYLPSGNYQTGLMLDEVDTCEGVPAEGLVGGFVRHLDVQPGDEIILAVYNFSGGGSFTLSFGGDAVLDCTIVGELDYAECDDDADGQVQFDLTQIATDITNGDQFLNVTYYSTEEDATNDTGLNTIPTAPYTVTTTTSPDVIYAQVKNDAGEIEEILTITLSISESVTGAQNADYFACDLGGDGTEIVDLTDINVIANPSNYTIRYYEDEQDAMDGNATFISNPTSYTTGTTVIYVRIENENGCYAIAEINILVSGLEVELGDGFSMCDGAFELTASGDFSGFTNVTYTWTRNSSVIEGATTQTITITEPGTYGVTVTTDEGCSGSDTVVVTPGETPVITSVTVGPNNVMVEATGGVQPYEYSLTGYVWQASNQFNYLQPGIHTIYVRSAEGCIASQQFAVFFIPTMFTPNGDGINDTWNIPGLEIYPESNVNIYDRNGRLVYQSVLNSHVIWNGFFMNGQKAPTQDYWYVINVSDGRQFTGHVTVKSRGEKQ